MNQSLLYQLFHGWCAGKMGLKVWPMDPSREISWDLVKNQTPGSHLRPHESKSLGGIQGSPHPDGFSEDSCTRPGQRDSNSGLVGWIGRCPLLMEMLPVACYLSVPVCYRASITFLLQGKTFQQYISFKLASQPTQDPCRCAGLCDVTFHPWTFYHPLGALSLKYTAVGFRHLTPRTPCSRPVLLLQKGTQNKVEPVKCWMLNAECWMLNTEAWLHIQRSDTLMGWFGEKKKIPNTL